MAKHIQWVEIEAYRGICGLRLDNLGDINILVGDNNSGKTSALEALSLLSSPSDISNVIRVSRNRDAYRSLFRSGPDLFESFIYIFNRKNHEMKIAVSGEIRDKQVRMSLQGDLKRILVDIEEIMKYSAYPKERSKDELLGHSEEVEGFVGELSVSFGNELIKEPIYFHRHVRHMMLNQKPSFITVRFISTVDHIFDNTFKSVTKDRKVREEVIQLLQIFDAEITDLRIVENDSRRYVHMIEHNSLGSMPISTYGDGIKKVVSLANAIVQAKDGVLLIDEVETSIHKNAMKKVFSWIIDACQTFNVQLFLTTHSLEAVDELLNSTGRIVDHDLARVITLVKKDDQVVARILSGERALQVREDYDMELRV